MAVEAVMPIFRAAVDAAEQHVLRMHSQDFGTADAPSVAGASPYMADLVRHISHCRCVPPCSSMAGLFCNAALQSTGVVCIGCRCTNVAVVSSLPTSSAQMK